MAVSLHVVMSVCRENAGTAATALQAYANRLHDTGYNPVRVVVVCKCVQHSRCDMKLPNVGREGHTWLSWLGRQHHQLSDVTLFVNPGFASSSHASGIWHKAFILGQTVASIARVAKVERTLLQHTCTLLLLCHARRQYGANRIGRRGR